ncbi:arylsulfotransferase family protein [Cereibacter sphaeroides]|uniref:arylsulfotransferase family protein n=1 Tax=Rhodobacterales TaxID=204455 RepID=UPI000BBF085B|nr:MULTISPECIES: arylsulfotransferase family protein [Paracoccaceae]MCE6960634.1 arylsulfotransferase family protein [Cereibacter sphaeroides]MCE6973264.1 arylsulfotransferase family protein [Cereibacter sphaeroides]
MDRTVPLWLVLFLVLVWLLLTVAFGWAVKATVYGSDSAGAAGRAAVAIASFPTTTKDVLLQLASQARGEYEDEALGLPRDPGIDTTGFVPIDSGPDLDIPGLLVRADHDRMVPGRRLIAGAFEINGEIRNAALLLSPDLKVERSWMLDEIAVGGQEPRETARKFVHGVEILRDGSLIFTFDGSISLQRFDACGGRLWTTPGNFHHSVAQHEEAGTVWTFSDWTVLAEVSVEDGRVLRQIAVEDIIARNPMIDILGLRIYDENDPDQNQRNVTGEWLYDPFHFNDAEPLPAALAAAFPGFEAGDLLISARSLNLVFVLDPDTLQIKWWRVGATQRQHDPDWLPDGTISVLDNRMSRDASAIKRIDPVTYDATVKLDGQKMNFFTRIRGKHQTLENGGTVVSSTQQGRAFETDAEGHPVLEVLNHKPGDESLFYVISEMRWLPSDYFTEELMPCTVSQ